MCQDKRQNLYCRAKPGESIVPLRHSVLSCYRPYLMTETFIIARGGGAKKLFPEVEMQYLLTLQVSRYCMLALQSRVPPFSLHNSQLQLWRVGGGGGVLNMLVYLPIAKSAM